MESGVIERHSFDLNIPCVGDDQDSVAGSSQRNEDEILPNTPTITRKRKRAVRAVVNSRIYQDLCSSRGGIVKAHGDVLRVRNVSSERPPNVICKVEHFGKLVTCFDEKKKSWVCEMGFGPLLFLVNMKLPTSLCYWLMTRIDPVKERLVVGGLQFRFSPTQVRWILGIPKGDLPVPTSFLDERSYSKIVELEQKYGHVWTSVDRRSGKVDRRAGFAVTHGVADRLMSPFADEEAEEFKILFLMTAVDMVLCPTQCSPFSKDLVPALSCALNANNYNWCALVLDKLMSSVKRFGSRFYSEGFASGCGGCTLFVAIFYLDKLDRNSVMWGEVPRIKVWTQSEIKKACDDDRVNADGDFGYSGVLDIAYGEKHPSDARDAEIPADLEKRLQARV